MLYSYVSKYLLRVAIEKRSVAGGKKIKANDFGLNEIDTLSNFQVVSNASRPNNQNSHPTDQQIPNHPRTGGGTTS